MKKIIKILSAVALSVAMMSVMAFPTSALVHNSSTCGSSRTVVACGTYRTTNYDSHYLHTNTYCSRKGYVYDHYKACAGCGANNGALGGRICSRSHQYCPTEYNLCKY